MSGDTQLDDKTKAILENDNGNMQDVFFQGEGRIYDGMGYLDKTSEVATYMFLLDLGYVYKDRIFNN